MAFNKHRDFIVHQKEPFNAEPDAARLREAWLTPNDLFYVRNHGPVPQIDPETYRLEVGGRVKRPMRLSLEELKRLPKRTVTSTLQCAGNRRQAMMAMKPIPGEVGWGDGAIGNARWAGVSLREVLEQAGLEPEARHAVFIGLDEIVKGGNTFGFGGSVPLEKAMQNDVLLAYEMNGEPLPPVHGFPLRVVVPGYIGARSVKWLSQVTLQDEPSQNFYQTLAYKLFPSNVTVESADWNRGMMLGEFPVNSVICEPRDGAGLPAGPVTVRGYAIAGGNRTVERVDVSADGGEHWVEADLTDDNQPGAWRFWEAQLELKPGTHEITVRAWDSAAHTQPEEVRQVWNFKGYFNNAWHRVRVKV